MGRFQSCKSVVERALRRAFYDGVLELYEGHGSTDTVTAVTLEGTLTLTINRAETLVIRLNEVAQRAEEVTTEFEDHVRDTHEGDQHGGSDKETESTSKKRKRDAAETLEEEKKTVMKLKKEVKVETDCYDMKKQATPIQTSEKPREIARECNSAQLNQIPETTGEFQSDVTETAKQVVVKKEPRGNLSDFMSYASPDHSDSHHGAVSEGTIVSKSEDPSPSSPKGQEESFPVTVKREPKVESIVIEDDDDDDDDRTDSSQQKYSNPVPQLSPVHSLWYKRSHGSRQHHPSHRTSGRGHTQRKNYLSSYGMDSPDAQQMALLLERNDCPVCGEVLHNRQELSSHLHAHRHVLQSSCSVCHANTLTLDALLLHLSTMHSPHILSMSPAASSDTLFSQALIPALPYAHGPMSAIASLVSMAACQAGPSSSALFGSGGGMAGGMSSLMEQIIAYRGLLPCPICQLLCSSKQHLAAHVTLMHGSSVSGGQGEERESTLDNNGDEAKLETRQDSDTEGSSSSSSFFCFDCSIGFSSHALFAQHCMLQHNSTSVVNQGSCSVCHRVFDTWKTLHAHYLAAHGITNFCDRCKMGFTSTTELKTHYDSTHSAENRGLTFICDICNKGFYSQSQCSAHKRSHISEKSFACQVCGSAFFKRGDLSKHFRTVHAPNRVFACRFCGKRGTRMDNMRSHVKSHGKHMTRDEVLSFIEEVKS